MTFRPIDDAEAGLAAVQDDDHFPSIGVVRRGRGPAVCVALRAGPAEDAAGRIITIVPVAALPSLRLRIHARGVRHAFDYAIG